MKRSRLWVAGGMALLVAALFVAVFRSAPLMAANNTGGNDTTTLQLAPPRENPTLVPKTTPDLGGLPPIDIGSLTGNATATPTAGAGQTNVVVQSDFSECNPIEDDYFLIECKNGEMNFTRKETAGTRYLYYRPVLTDARIDVRVRLPSQKNARYGVIFRLDEEFQNYYILGVSNAGKYGLFRFNNGQYETIIPYTDSFNVGNASFPTHIEIVNQGDVIAFKLGGEWVDIIRDPNLTAGRVALFVEPDEPNQTVLFDDLEIDEILSPLPVPAPRVIQPAASPTPAGNTLPVFNFPTATTAPVQPPATTAAPQPTQTPFIIVVTATPEPKTAAPTRRPTQRPTEEACPAGPNEAVLYISNNYTGTMMRFTIGGGEWKTHDFDIPGDGKYYFIKMPPGRYTYTAFIPGKGKANGEKQDYLAGQCYSLRFSP